MKHFTNKSFILVQRWREKHPVLSWGLLHIYRRHHFHLDSLKQVLPESHGVIQAERDTGGLQSNHPLPKAGLDTRSDQGAQGFIRVGLGNLQGWRHCSLFCQSVTLLGSPNSEKNSSYPVWISLVSAYACCLSLSHHSLCEEPSSASLITLCRYWGLLRGAPEAIAAWGWTRPSSADFFSQSKCCSHWPSR